MFAKSTKTVVAALVLAGTSLTFVANAHAAPVNTQSQAEQSYKKDRHNATDTNGKRPAPPPVVLPGDGRT